MNSLNLSETGDTPRVVLDKENSTFEIIGKSYPNNAFDFYEPILKWLNDYSKKPNPETIFTFQLDYYNTASSKRIFNIMNILELLPNAKIKWLHRADDDDMENAGIDFSDLIDVDFEFVVFS
jgi:SiaC family regulatory phosphoprotein